jgi:hypothetical protein
MQSDLIGGSWISTGTFLLSVVLTITLIQQLATLSLGEIDESTVRQVLFIFILIVVLMTATLYRSQHG